MPQGKCPNFASRARDQEDGGDDIEDIKQMSGAIVGLSELSLHAPTATGPKVRISLFLNSVRRPLVALL